MQNACDYADPAIPAPTEVYVPDLQFPDGFEIDIEGDWAAAGEQMLSIRAASAGRMTLTLRANPPE